MNQERNAESDALAVIRSYLEQALPFLGITVPQQVEEAIATLSGAITTRVTTPAEHSDKCCMIGVPAGAGPHPDCPGVTPPGQISTRGLDTSQPRPTAPDGRNP